MMGELGLWWLRSALDVGLLSTSWRYSCMTYTHTVCEQFHCAAMRFALIKRRGCSPLVVRPGWWWIELNWTGLADSSFSFCDIEWKDVNMEVKRHILAFRLGVMNCDDTMHVVLSFLWCPHPILCLWATYVLQSEIRQQRTLEQYRALIFGYYVSAYCVYYLGCRCFF